MRSVRQGAKGSGVIERSAPLWQPSVERIAQAELTKFSGFVAERFQRLMYPPTKRYTVVDNGTTDFWRCIWDYSDVIASHESDEVVRDLTKCRAQRGFRMRG